MAMVRLHLAHGKTRAPGPITRIINVLKKKKTIFINIFRETSQFGHENEQGKSSVVRRGKSS